MERYCSGSLGPPWAILDRRHRKLCRLLFRLRFLVQRVLHLLDNRFEGGCVVDRNIGQNFAIEADSGCLQSFSEPAVGQAVGTGGGVQALDPKITESALARFAIAIGPILALHRRIFSVTEKF